MNKVPGGLIIIPLLVAILINTFAPQVLSSIGGPTTALFKVGFQRHDGHILLICGTSINIRQAGLLLYKGASAVFLKMSGRGTGGMGCGNVVWPERFSRNIDPGADCLPDQPRTAPLYIALCSNYGDASDAGAISVFCIRDGPVSSYHDGGWASAAWPIFPSPRCCRC